MYICPSCGAVPFFGAEWNIIHINQDLFYCLCSNCNRAFKFIRREISHLNDSCGWEYTLKDKDGKLYAIRGYSITLKTFKEVSYQHQLVNNFFSFKVNEIDDLFKEFSNDDKDCIYNFVGSAFKDHERYKNQIKYNHWHNHENIDEI
jgi:hypothetical protein